MSASKLSKEDQDRLCAEVLQEAKNRKSDPEATASEKAVIRIGNTGFRVSVLTMLGFIAFYLTLWSDRHNDGRYVQLESYKQDSVQWNKRWDEQRQTDKERTTSDALAQAEQRRLVAENINNQFTAMKELIGNLRTLIVERDKGNK